MSHHQDAAKAFLKMAGAGIVQEAYDRYIAPSFHGSQINTSKGIGSRC
jgi:hypothetical protein